MSDDKRSRQGDVLGLGGSRVPHEPSDPHASDDPEEVRRRRERMREDSSRRHAASDATDDIEHLQSGFESADMGAGGEGTSIDED